MMSIRSKMIVAMLGFAVSLPASVAKADLKDAFLIGLNQFDYTVGLKKNQLGKGYNFSATAPYTGQNFDFGIADLTLGATSASSVKLAAGYTTRGIPEANFSLATSSNPLSYTFQIDPGFQKLTATGTVAINISTKVNALGFYDETFQISNRGTYTNTGWLTADKTGSLNFDAGPIVVSGNIYTDAAASLAKQFYDAIGVVNPFEKISSRSAKLANLDTTIDALNAKLAAGETLTSAETNTLVNNTIMAAILGEQPSSDLLGSFIVPDDFLNQATKVGPMAAVITPEPGSLGLLLVGLLALRPNRRPRR